MKYLHENLYPNSAQQNGSQGSVFYVKEKQPLSNKQGENEGPEFTPERVLKIVIY